MHSLRFKTTFITIAAVLASVLVFALAGFFTVGRESSTSSTEKMNLVAQNAQQSLDSYLNGLEQSVLMAYHLAGDSLDGVLLSECGANVAPEKRSAEQTERLDDHIHQHWMHVMEAFGSVASHTKGCVTYYYCINPDVSIREHGFFYSRVGKAGFEEQEPLDARELDPNDIEHTTWYYTPIKRGTPSWIGPYKAHFLDEALTVSYLTPIYKSGVLIGVLGMDILFETMTEQVGSIKVYDTGYACLLDEQGDVLYHPQIAMGETSELSDQILKGGILQRSNSEGSIIRYDKEGETWQLAFSTISNGDKIVVTAPVSEVTAQWRKLLGSIPLIAVVTLALFIPLMLVAMRSIIRPLQQLTRAANSLAAGNYDVKLDYHSRDEVGELTAAFRHLRDHLQVYISNINSSAYVDTLTGVRNEGAYDISAARMNDVIARSEKADEPQFALALFKCVRLAAINEQFGHAYSDAHFKATCQLICQIFGNSSVFRMGVDGFVVMLQGRDYHNRQELMRDFDIVADEHNAETTEEWLHINAAKGLATFRPDDDQSIEVVMSRAAARMHEDALRCT